MIFFLFSVGTVAHDADFHLTLLRLKSSYSTNILRLQQLKLISNSTSTATSTVHAMITTILRSKGFKLLSYNTCTTFNIVYSSPSSS